MSEEYIFKRSPKEYSLMKDPVSTYLKQASAYLSKMNSIPIEQATQIVKKSLRKHPIKNPEVLYYTKDQNGDKYKEVGKLSTYIKEAYEDDNIIAPSFTTYVSPKVKKSIHAEFLEENINKRKEDKHKAAVYKQDGNMELHTYYNTLQKTRKIFNNSLSGAYAAKGTVLYEPTSHYTLTSMTRSVTSIGNAITESMIASNKHFKDYDVTMGYLTTIITTHNLRKMAMLIKKYSLYIPKPEEVFEHIKYSTNPYWASVELEEKLLIFLKSLNKIEICSVLYVNDMNALRKYNDKLTREFLTKLSKKCTTGSIDNIMDINRAPEGIMNLVSHVCSEEIKGINVNYKKLANTELLMTLASTAKNATDTLVEYTDLIRTLFVTDIMPPTIGYIKDMFRDSIVLSDTDSTCGSYDSWVNWYFGKTLFSPEATAFSAAVMTINTQVIDHYLKIFTSHMNVPIPNRELIKMKNEFFWDVFTSTNVSKHYFANIRIQEGVVFAVPDLELKGVHLIASSVNKEIRDIAYDMIEYIHKTLTSNQKISLKRMATITANLERKIIKDISEGKTNVFKIDKIKEENAYKLDKLKSPYIHHMLWTEVFMDKYGNPGDPTYMVINIPTIMKSKRTLAEYITTLDDREIAEKLESFLKKYNKDMLGTFRVPLAISSGKKLPEEIFKAVDFHKVVTNNVNILYLILESVGFFRKPTMLVSEMGY